MFFIPFPLLIAEIAIFFLGVRHWGFLNTLGVYLAPCLLGFLVVSFVGRLALVNLQSSMMGGQLPANKILHSGAVFLSGLLFLVPTFFTRVLGLILFLPGLRHLAIWAFKISMAKKIAQGAAFSRGPFGFSGFRYYEFRNDGQGFRSTDEHYEEREVRDAAVLDVTPLKITHEEKKDEKKSE